MRFLASLLVSITLLAAQKPSSFEVTSVKRSPKNQYVPVTVNPQRFWAVMDVAGAILWANDLVDQGYKLSGGPQWIHSKYFEIEGRAKSPATKKEMQSMVQSLLADRFKLKTHRETKQMPVYALVVGRSGSKLKVSTESCAEDGCIGVAPTEFFARGAKMDAIAATLSNMLGRPVLDQTGLDKRYEFRMKFTDTANIFAAIQDLGLTLETRRAPVEVIVVDSASEPALN